MAGLLPRILSTDEVPGPLEQAYPCPLWQLSERGFALVHMQQTALL